ncbi:pentapeptide repeat-containing protein [Paramicrobacterium fandaimingii]|uniref:pentapeptide repeat-containing protein n=1 Tax=Paramicrobacterium fandaimingii TaxID=2708079 RepID=UPI001424665E|nr:pentapeptide repeat-containing protein [Microbacterium fandaimingii]
MTVSAPRFQPPSLHDLRESDLHDLRAGDLRDGESFTGASLADRDLADLTFSECAFTDLALGGLVCRGVRVTESTIISADGATVSAPSSTVRDVDVSHSRIGSLEGYDSRWNGVRFTGCKLGYINLRGSALADIVFEDCQIDELDLGAATAKRMSFHGCRIGTLEVPSATLTDVDLRGLDLARIVGIEGLSGAVIDEGQLLQLAPVLAAQLGIEVV